jgi:hypothetical protein
MKNKTLILASVSAAVLSFFPAAHAETITTKTYVKAKEQPNVNKVNFDIFDINNDGIYSMPEVGERLFISFDRDGNKLIDNIEWDKKTVLTIAPMEQETFQFVDYNDDGYTDRSTYNYQTFYQASGLVRFDDNADGLSARDFVEVDIQKLDNDDNNMIDLKEWKEAYLASRPEHEKPESYN